MGPPSMENLIWKSHHICALLPWKCDTVLCVLSYTFSFISTLDHSDFFTSDAIIALEKMAKSLYDRAHSYDEIFKTRQREFSEMLVDSFFSKVVKRFFTVPKQLPKSNQHLYPNEILAGFINFLLQVLFHQTNYASEDEDEDEVQRWALMRKELSFLLALLGDVPFQCTHNNHKFRVLVTNLLAVFERLANETGCLVYDGVFHVDTRMIYTRIKYWTESFQHLYYNKISDHCSEFSKLTESDVSRSRVVESFFIVHSLIEDIENLMIQRLNFNHADVIKLAELIQSQSFIIVMQDNEEKESLIKIRNLAYEAEYLINSLVVGNLHDWYLNLRLPSIIQKITTALEQISETTGIMDDSHFLDFNHDITDKILKDQSDYMKIFQHSYIHMPHKLKPCFLYFAAFTKDSQISQEKLTWMWVAEGFVQKEGNKSAEDTAEMYLLDLINRNLVMIIKKGSDGRIKECKIQSDLLHEFCVRKAEEENFIKVINSKFSMYERCQRLFVSPSSDICWRPFGLHCRSYRDLHGPLSSYCFQTMALLKVVDLLAEAYRYPRDLAALAFPGQLRYLGKVGDLSNKMVANLVNLEYICVRRADRIFYVPSVDLRLVKLRHLVIDNIGGVAAEFKFEEDYMKETTNLRTLSGVCINGTKDEDILRCFPHLHKLKYAKFKDEQKFPDLSFLAELESLELYFDLSLTDKILASNIKIPPTIKKLDLYGSGLPWEMMSIIGRLPNLEVLKLSHRAIHEVWETRDGAFQKLKFLKIYRCYSLRVWMSCSAHFPVLECLVLEDCINLLEIPSDFGNIPTLHRIQLNGYYRREACFSALQIQIRKPSIQLGGGAGVGVGKLMEELRNNLNVTEPVEHRTRVSAPPHHGQNSTGNHVKSQELSRKEQLMASSRFIYEKDINLTADVCPFVVKASQFRNWQNFFNPHMHTSDDSLVRELYAQISVTSRDDGFIYCRGGIVQITDFAINKVYGTTTHLEKSLPPDFDSASDIAKKILNCIAVPNTTWITYSGTIRRMNLKFEANVWLTIINNRLMPSANKTECSYERAYYIYALMNNIQFDVGYVILRNIARAAASRTRSCIGFPCLITELCRRGGIQPNVSESTIRPSPTITDSYVKNFKVRDSAEPETGKRSHKPKPDVQTDNVRATPKANSRSRKKAKAMVLPAPLGPPVAQPATGATSSVLVAEDSNPRQHAARRLDWCGVDPASVDSQEAAYVDILNLKGNRPAANGCPLEYAAPAVDDDGICVCFSDEDVEEEIHKWEHSLVLNVIGADHSLSYMESFIEQAWGHAALPVLHQLEDGFFIARFDNAADCDLVFRGGPYTVKNQPLVLKKWTVGFEFKKDQFTTWPIWIKFPKLPLEYWGKKSLGKLASAAGKPIHTDECTGKQTRVAFARVLVEVDVSQPLVKVVRIKNSAGSVVEQPIQYEWTPSFCQKCQNIGHDCN